MLHTEQTAEKGNRAFVPATPDQMTRLREAAKNAPRATTEQKTSLESTDGQDLPLISAGKVTRRGGDVVEFFYTKTTNVHGFYVTFIELTRKDKSTEMKEFSGRRVRGKCKDVAQARFDRAKQNAQPAE